MQVKAVVLASLVVVLSPSAPLHAQYPTTQAKWEEWDAAVPRAPMMPKMLQPTGAVDVPVTVELLFESIGAKDGIEVRFGIQNNPPIVQAPNGTFSYKPPSLLQTSTKYNVRVRGRGNNLWSQPASFSFTTAAATPSPPAITCPLPISKNTLPGESAVAVTWEDPIVTGGSPPVVSSCQPTSGTSLQIGTSSITCTATDSLQRAAMCSFTATVIPSAKFSIGQRVQVYSGTQYGAGAAVRPMPSFGAPIDQVQPAGVKGTVRVGPQIGTGAASAYVWWTIDFDTGADGWVTELNLDPCLADCGVLPPPPLPQCQDGVDNDGDGKTDFGDDPGCSSLIDVDERDTVPPLPVVELGVSPDPVVAGQSVVATWANIPVPLAQDWLALYVQTAPDANYINWWYVSCAQTPGVPRAGGSCNLSVPSTLPTGLYDVRLFANDDFTIRYARSASFTVTSFTPARLEWAVGTGGCTGQPPCDTVGFEVFQNNALLRDVGFVTSFALDSLTGAFKIRAYNFDANSQKQFSAFSNEVTK